MKRLDTWAIWALIFLTPPFKLKVEAEDLTH